MSETPSPTKKRSTMGDLILQVSGLLILLVCVFACVEHLYFYKARPPFGLSSISEFRRWRPEITTAIKTEIDGATYYVIPGGDARFLSSAYSEFYFDAMGNYVSWNVDVGDYFDPSFLHPNNRTKGRVVPIDSIPAQ